MPTAHPKGVTIAVLAAALSLAGSVLAAKDPGPEDQLKFGVQMAKRGLWSEALFRFDQALSQAPGDPQILNNLAVAYEAVGRFEDALETYKRALQSAPNNRELKRNYALFIEFYQGFRPREPAQAAAAEAEEAADDDPGGP